MLSLMHCEWFMKMLRELDAQLDRSVVAFFRVESLDLRWRERADRESSMGRG